MSALDKFLLEHKPIHCTCGMDDNMHETTCVLYEFQAAKIEAGQLRADNAALREAVEQARKLIFSVWETSDCGTSAIEIETSSPLWQIESDTRAWLSAHPAEVKA
jgi:hypothetical protein